MRTGLLNASGDRYRAETELPASGGAYLLYFAVEFPLALAIPRLGDPILNPGGYVYAGSAWGPGGLRARVARHLRSDKPRRWHVDHLAVGCRMARVFPGGRECALVADLSAAGATFPVRGFGSSDCRGCEAHLLRLPDR